MRVSRCFGVLALVCFSGLARAEVSKAQSEAFAQKVEALIAARDTAGFSACFDVDTFVDKCFRGVQHPALADVKSGMREGMAHIGDQLCASFKSTSDGATFVHARTLDGAPTMTFRISTEEGFNYWDLYVDDSKGEPKITDVHIAMSGEDFSQSMQRIILRMLSGTSEKATPQDKQMIADMQALTAAVRSGKAEEALTIADRMPEKMKKEKFIQLLRVQAAAKLEDTSRADSICDEFREQFGDDPACDLVMIDPLIRRKDLEHAMACVDRLDASVGVDPFLGVIRGNLHAQIKNDATTAKKMYDRALQNNPDLFEAADAELMLAITNNDFPEMKRVMLMIENHPKWEFVFDEDLAGAELYAAFKQSPEYAAWLKERPKKQ